MSNKSNSFNEALWAFKNTLNAAYQLGPAIVVVAIILAAIVAYVSLFFIEILQGFIILLIIIISVLVYYKSNNYGEAGLALMAGLLAAFTVDWTMNKSLVFMAALLGFLLFILLVGSIKIAAKNESIFLDAAIYISIIGTKENAQKLRKLSNEIPTKKLGPIDKAEVIRIMAYRKISMDSMKYILKMTDIISSITNIDIKYVAIFIIDFTNIFNVAFGPRYEHRFDELFSFFSKSPVSREEVVKSFMNSKSLVIFGKVEPDTYNLLLKEALDKGVRSEETYDFIEDRINMR